MPQSAPLRVAQWATGNIGLRALQRVIEHDHLDLVGVRVYSADKVGIDAGTLCGLEPIGVAATDDLADILALAADCVLYMPSRCDLDDVCRILASGANIVTTRGEFHRPASMDPDDRARVEAACAEGGSSIHSTGSSPGFITEALPIVLTSLQRRLDLLTIDEFADVSSRNSPDMIFKMMGFGSSPDDFAMDFRLGHLRDSFGPSLRMLADIIGKPLDTVDAAGEVSIATRDTEIAAGTIPAGTVGAQRITITGSHDGEPLLRFRANWYCVSDLDRDWDLQSTGWRVQVDGDAPLDMRIHFPVAPEEMAATTPGLTAHRPVNAIAAVCAAEPGIRTIADLPQIIAELG